MTKLCYAFLNMKKTENWLRKVTHSFEVHSNESACRNKWTSWSGTSLPLYIYSTKNPFEMHHKIVYAKIGVLNLCCWNMKIISSWINKKRNYLFEMYNDSPIISYPQFGSILTGRCPKNQYLRPPKWCHKLLHCVNTYSYIPLGTRTNQFGPHFSPTLLYIDLFLSEGSLTWTLFLTPFFRGLPHEKFGFQKPLNLLFYFYFYWSASRYICW